MDAALDSSRLGISSDCGLLAITTSTALDCAPIPDQITS